MAKGKKKGKKRSLFGRIGFIPFAIGCKVLSGYGFTAALRKLSNGATTTSLADAIDEVANTSPTLMGMLGDVVKIGVTGKIYRVLPKMNMISTRFLTMGA